MERRSQRLYLALLAAFFLVLVGLSFWHTSLSFGDFQPGSAVIGVVLWAMFTLVAIGVLALSFMLLRNLVKLYVERRQGRLGSKIKTKLVVGSLLLSLVPVAAMVVFSFTILSRTFDKWLFSPTREVVRNAELVTEELTRIMREKTEAEAAWVASLPDSLAVFLEEPEADGARERLTAQMDSLQADYVGFLAPGERKAGWEAYSDKLIEGPVAWRLPEASSPREGGADGIQSGVTSDFVWGFAPMRVGGKDVGGVVVAWLIPEQIQSRRAQVQDRYEEYLTIEAERTNFKYFYLSLLALIAVFVLFVAVWLSLFLSKQISVPIEALVQAMAEVSSGRLEHRVHTQATDELGGLVESFNNMTQRLEQQTHELQQSNRDLERANDEIEARRRFINAILESITPAVLSVNAKGVILKANSAVQRIFQSPDAEPAERIEDLFGGDQLAEVNYMLNRARRTGHCAREFEVPREDRILHLAVTVSALETPTHNASDPARFVVVVEDTTELLRAQKAAAWHEVARRVAHEIKNPLTPIVLSAERMERLLDRFVGTADPDEREELKRRFERSTRTIAGEVQTLRRLVDEFAQLARFPKAHPKRGDLNAVVAEAAAVFEGRLADVRLRVETAPELPAVMIDSEQFKRVVVNLVDNAAEAVQGAWMREILVETSPGGMPDTVQLVVADSGSGVSAADKEKLFLPYFSTKDRGTGLGLAIVSRIVGEHGGSIRVEDNRPSGSRFIVELPTAETPALAGVDS